MSVNLFYVVVDQKQLEDCIENNDDIHSFLNENAIKETSSESFSYDLSYLMQYNDEIGIIMERSYNIDDESAPMATGYYSPEQIDNILNTLKNIDIQAAIDEFIKHHAETEDFDAEFMNEILFSTIEDIKSIFEFAKAENKTVVSYIG